MSSVSKITAEQLAEYVDLDAQRLALSRKAAALGKRQSALSAHFLACLEGSKQKSTTKGGYTARLVEGKGSVSWKDEVIRLVGPLEAAKISEGAPTKTKVEVEGPPAKSAKKAA